MLGLLFVGVSLILGIFMKLGSYTGMLMLFLMYTAAGLSPENNPFIDDHIIYIFVILSLVLTNSSEYLGLGKWWGSTSFIQKHKLFK
jgi:thiosulfate dehydrogenase [quinone] large subunit